jgi:hypothetical protein
MSCAVVKWLDYFYKDEDSSLYKTHELRGIMLMEVRIELQATIFDIYNNNTEVQYITTKDWGINYLIYFQWIYFLLFLFRPIALLIVIDPKFPNCQI